MIKKACLTLLILMINTISLAQTTNSAISAQSNQAVVLKDLNFKTVMMAFYQKQLKHIVIPELDQEKAEYVGIQSAEHTAIRADQAGVLIFSPAEIYHNLKQEKRYLLTITEFGVDADDRSLNFCGACASFTQVFIFKKNDADRFELVSRSDQEEGWMNGDFNFLPYPPKSLTENIRQIGPNVQAYVEEQEYSRQGYSSTTLYIMPLDENLRIIKMKVAEIGHDNEVTGHDQIYNMQGDYQFLNTQHNGLYDIEIKYSGTQQIDDTNGKTIIVPKNTTEIYHYSKKMNQYMLAQELKHRKIFNNQL